MLATRVKPDEELRLSKIDPDDSGDYTGKDDPAFVDKMSRLMHRLDELQERLYAEQRQALLVVLQAMDTGGKDGVLRIVVGPLDSRGVHVVSFKAPTPEELSHDFYLWALSREDAAQRRGHVLQSLALRGRARRARARHRRQERVEAALRHHQRLGARAHARRHARREVVPAHLEGRAEAPHRRAPRRSEQALEVRSFRPWQEPASTWGRLHVARLTRTRSPAARRRKHRGTSCPRITNGHATSRSPRSW